MTNKTGNQPSAEFISRLRELAKGYDYRQDYESAAFWAEKVLYLSKEPKDAYQRAKCLYNLGEFNRAAYTIKSRNLHQTHLDCLYLAAQCHYKEKDFKEAFQLLESPLIPPPAMGSSDTSETQIATPPVGRNTRSVNQHSVNQQMKYKQENQVIDKSVKRWLGAIFLLKGKLYEYSDNRADAEICFREALMYDIFCVEAYSCLTRHHMLTIDDEKKLLTKLDLDGMFSEDQEMGEFMKLFYNMQVKKYHKPMESIIPQSVQYLSNNADIEAALAERNYFNCDYHSAYELTSSILEKDAYHLGCLPVYIISLMEIDKPTQLFDIAHQLVDLYPENAISWFAVGCYYLLINKIEPARRYLSKATSLDNVFGYAWMVYGHSFAVEREHDQAMAAYFRASHLMRGCHLPLLFIGVEYGRANDYILAEEFLGKAKAIAADDPFVLHEYGIIHYNNKDYIAALSCFRKAEGILRDLFEQKPGFWLNSDRFKQKWEPLLNNLGHTLRQLGLYDEAIEYHNKALTLIQANASTFSALGFLYYLKGDWDQALEYINNALSIRYNDSISTSLLEKTIPKYNEALREKLNKSIL